ncbi:MAG: permease [Leptospiraceae bacterium]|nr:permease [Leptospiraceae bacterium]
MNQQWVYFLGSLLGFLIGPFLHTFFLKRKKWHQFLDGFSLTAVGGIALVYLLPEAISNGGFRVLAVILLGIFLPRFIEKIVSVHRKSNSILFLIFGLFLHTLIESAAMGGVFSPEKKHLALAIVLHRFPVALLLFSFIRREESNAFAGGVILLLILSSVLGFSIGPGIESVFSSEMDAYLEVFVASSLLHVAIENHYHKQESITLPSLELSGNPILLSEVHPNNLMNWISRYALFSTLGALGGIFLVIVVMGQPNLIKMNLVSLTFLETFLALSLRSAPALILAYVSAVFLKTFLPPYTIEGLNRGNSVSRSIKGVLFGFPLPVCSCGVLPIYDSMIKRGIPVTAAMGFLIATPGMGLDALLISVPLLGLELSVIRLFLAFLVAILTAYFIGKYALPKERSTDKIKIEDRYTIREKFRMSVEFGFVELFDHTLPWILMGLFIASIIEPLLDYEYLGQLTPFWQVPLFALIGMPFYVCATGATPIAAIAIHKGISAGAALAFLIAGPVTNATTFVILSRIHNRKTAILFGLVVSGLAVIFGWSINVFKFPVAESIHAFTDEKGSLIQWISLWIFVFLLLLSLLRQGPRGLVKQITSPIHTNT